MNDGTNVIVCDNTGIIKFVCSEGMDSSATDSGTEDVLGSQMLVDPLKKKYRDHTVSHDECQPRQYRTKKVESDGDWLAKRSGSDLRAGRQHKVISIADACFCVQCLMHLKVCQMQIMPLFLKVYH